MKKPRKQTTLREDIGKLLLDVGKLMFGSIFLGSILRGEVPRAILGASGFAAAMIMFIIGICLVKKEKETGE